MKIGIIGATGKLGKLLLKEAIDRGHEVTPIIRDANKLDYSTKNLIEKSINELTTEDINSFDNVISAFGVPMGNGEIHISISKKLINIFEGTNIRLLIVGGAGSLYIDNNSKKN